MKKHVIRLAESDLYRMIKESVQTILQNNDNEDDFDINSIDISDIDIEILKQSYIDLRLVPTRISYDDPLSKFHIVNESEGDIMPPDNVVNAIIQKYHLNSHLVVKVEASNKIYIYIITACIGNNEKLIEDDMKKMGYFLGIRGQVQNIQGMLFRTLQFEPYSQMQNDETTNIKQVYNHLYHWTPEYHLNNILQNGLIPSHQNKVFNYPQRIYLMKGDCDLFQMKDLGQQLCFVNTDQRNNGKYVLLRIDLSNIGDDVHFYYDPNSKIGIYTEQAISPTSIKVVNEFTFQTQKKQIHEHGGIPKG